MSKTHPACSAARSSFLFLASLSCNNSYSGSIHLQTAGKCSPEVFTKLLTDSDLDWKQTHESVSHQYRACSTKSHYFDCSLSTR